ncbi:MAG: DNA primase [Lachnospiraceae bacterium]|nr:DNA primase [Lachnospiraceae bacterium]
MRYSDDLIEEVRSRNDIVDVVGMYVHLTKKSNRYWACCPFHGEKTASFTVNPQTQMFYCFGCHKGGNAITFVMEYDSLSFPEALKVLADRAGVQLPDVEATAEEKAQQNLIQRLYEVNKLAAGYFYSARKSERGKIADNYFKKRGLTDETIKHFGLGYSHMFSDDLYKFLKEKGYDDGFLKETGLVTFSEKGGHDKFWNRAMFPIMDERDRVIAFGGRVMGDGEPKYLNSPETRVFDKSNNLYGLNYAKLSRKGYFLLCEGYMDVISLHQAGFTMAVASLGTALTDKHATKISKYVKDVYLTYDSDKAGINAAIRAIPMLEAKGITVKIVNMKPYKDPDEFIKALGAEEYQKRIDTAESSFFFEIEVIKSRHNLEDPKEKSDFYTEVARRLLEFSGELERKNYEDAFVKRYNVPYKAFDELLIKVAGREGPKNRGDSYEKNQESPNREYRSKEEKQRDEKLLQPQRLLLTYLVNEPALYKKLKAVISPEEFTDNLYRKVAELSFSECESSGIVNAARITSLFEDKDDQLKVGEIFQTELKGDMSEMERMKAVEDLVRKIKLSAIETALAAAAEVGDSARVSQLFAEQIRLKNKNTKLF